MSNNIQNIVREKYGAVAGAGLSSHNSGVAAVAEAFGYTAEELNSIPAEANMGLSCGNPTALANLRVGEVVVDLGSGGGLDVFLAAKRVGPTGRAIGIDMTSQMIELARRNAEKSGARNVEFHQATIDRLPLADSSADVVISNCVINLATDKRAVFQEIFRVLKPGGRVAVSDIALKRPLPPEIARNVEAYVGCIAGAIEIDEYVDGLKSAGFAQVAVVDSGADLNAYSKVEGQSGCCSPSMSEQPPRGGTHTPEPATTMRRGGALQVTSTGCCGGGQSAGAAATGVSAVHDAVSDVLSCCNVNEYAASVKVYAVKP